LWCNCCTALHANRTVRRRGVSPAQVHGSLRFGVIYELGVLTGGLAFVAFDGGNDSVVGCSAGVYCIFGMHLAEIVLNW